MSEFAVRAAVMVAARACVKKRMLIMRIVKAAVIGLALVGFTGTTAMACGWGKGKKSAQTIKPGTKQTTISSDTKK